MVCFEFGYLGFVSLTSDFSQDQCGGNFEYVGISEESWSQVSTD